MKSFFATACLMILALPAFAAIKTEEVTYTHEWEGKSVTLKGLLAYDDAKSEKIPGVMVIHEWWGCNDYAKSRARKLAELGYVAFACDMFGDGKTTTDPNEAGRLAGQFQGNDRLRIGRIEAGLKVLRDHAMVDAARLGCMGYCFGGTNSLAIACAGTDGLKAVVSFHGSLWDLTPDQAADIKCKVLICNGAADTFIPVEQKYKFIASLEAAKIDFQFIDYSGAQHGFTNPQADTYKLPGVGYEEKADRRSWAHMKQLFDEAFSR